MAFYWAVFALVVVTVLPWSVFALRGLDTTIQGQVGGRKRLADGEPVVNWRDL